MSTYADNVVLFISPSCGEPEFTKNLLHKFGNASGLHTNMAKSSVIPIRCGDKHVQQVQTNIDLVGNSGMDSTSIFLSIGMGRQWKIAGLAQKKGIMSLAMLTVWAIWKERNSRTFQGKFKEISRVVDEIKDDASNWIMAGAKELGSLVGRQNRE
ncbi:hypothetical protein EJB05_39272, partial [Eragrostis curvula]